MNDPTEFPLFPRHHVWYVDETILVGETRFSPIFDIDRRMGISDGVQPAPTGADATGNADHMFRTIPIGMRIVAHFAETLNLAGTAPTLELFGSCDVATDPITEVAIRSDVIPVNSGATVGTALLLDTLQGFPYLQARIVNNDGDPTFASVRICGALRVFPLY